MPTVRIPSNRYIIQATQCMLAGVHINYYHDLFLFLFMNPDAVPYQNSYFGDHKYQSGITFNCFGNESSLASCRSSTSSSCDKDNAAGVHCRGEIITGSYADREIHNYIAIHAVLIIISICTRVHA